MEILASCVGEIPVSRSTTALRQLLPFQNVHSRKAPATYANPHVQLKN